MRLFYFFVISVISCTMMSQLGFDSQFRVKVDKADGYYYYYNKSGKKKLGPFFKAQDFPDLSVGKDSLVAPAIDIRDGNSSKWKFIDKQGKFISRCCFEPYVEIRPITGAWVVFKLGPISDSGGMVNNYGRLIVPVKNQVLRESAYQENWTVAPFGIRGKWGAINAKGDTIIPFIYDAVDASGKLFIIFSAASFYYVYNGAGNFITKSESRIMLSSYSEDSLCHVTINGKPNAVNARGDILFKQDEYFDYLYCYKEGLVLMEKNKKAGLFDYYGKEVLPCIYNNIRVENNFVFAAQADSTGGNEKWGLLNREGKLLLPFEYSNISIYSGWIIVEKTLKDGRKLKGLFDPDMKPIAPCAYSEIKPEGRYFITVKGASTGKYGALDYKGKMLIPAKFDEAFKDNAWPAQEWFTVLNGRRVMININGEVMRFVPDDRRITKFENGLFSGSVSKDHHHFNGVYYGVWTPSGKMLIDPEKYHYLVKIARNGLILYNTEKFTRKTAIMDTTGKENPVPFDGVSFYGNNSVILVCEGCKDRMKYQYGAGREVIFTGGMPAVVTGIDKVKVPRYLQFYRKRLRNLMKREEFTWTSGWSVVSREKQNKTFERKLKHMKEMNVKSYIRKYGGEKVF